MELACLQVFKWGKGEMVTYWDGLLDFYIKQILDKMVYKIHCNGHIVCFYLQIEVVVCLMNNRLLHNKWSISSKVYLRKNKELEFLAQILFHLISSRGHDSLSVKHTELVS